jgi:hypothetical protein
MEDKSHWQQLQRVRDVHQNTTVLVLQLLQTLGVLSAGFQLLATPLHAVITHEWHSLQLQQGAHRPADLPWIVLKTGRHIAMGSAQTVKSVDMLFRQAKYPAGCFSWVHVCQHRLQQMCWAAADPTPPAQLSNNQPAQAASKCVNKA